MKFLAATFGFVSAACAGIAAQPSNIRGASQTLLSEDEAIRIAERFVAENGFTVIEPLPGVTERNKKARASSTPSFDISPLPLRGMLAPKAAGVIANDPVLTRQVPPGWGVAFCKTLWYWSQQSWLDTSRDRNDQLLLVLLDPDGKNPLMSAWYFNDRDPGSKRLRKCDVAEPSHKITEEEAAYAADHFISRFSASASLGRDWGLPSDPAGKVRSTPHLHLWGHPVAVIERDIGRNAPGWSIGFCYDEDRIIDVHGSPLLENIEKRLRFVTMDPNGEEIDMADEDGDWNMPGIRRLTDQPESMFGNPPRCASHGAL